MAKKTKKKKTELEKRQAKHSNNIRKTFTDMGFEYINTNGNHFEISYKKMELDKIFIYENIIIFCEETCKNEKDKEHIRKKQETFRVLLKEKKEFQKYFCEKYPEKDELLKKFPLSRYKMFYFYCSDIELELTDNEYVEFNELKFLEPKELLYFKQLSNCIKKSSIYELYRFLNIQKKDIGVSSQSSQNEINASIIYPETASGFEDNVRIVSFMMSAETLLKNSYVLRKDNWDTSMWLYQRLIDHKKIKSIRGFLIQNKQSFLNNVIVALPDKIKFKDEHDKILDVNDMNDWEPVKIEIPEEHNSLCVIDGQHRIYAHYENNIIDDNEQKISNLRTRLHLLVTGLIFPENMPTEQRAKIQSEIFLDINSNAKSVTPDVLLNIKMLKDPFSDLGIARRVIEKLNKKSPFQNMFELSVLDNSKIKITSIIKYALKNLVNIKSDSPQHSLFSYWDGNKYLEEENDLQSLGEYIDFCANALSVYFASIKDFFRNEWTDKESKILSVTVINAFIMAFSQQLPKNEIQSFDFYKQTLEKSGWNQTFKKETFIYTSSQYRLFSKEILKHVFKIIDEQ